MGHGYRHFRLGLALACLCALTLVWAFAIWYVQRDTERDSAEVERQVRHTAQAFAVTAKLSLEVADQALQRLQYSANHASLADFSREALLLTDPRLGSSLNRAAWIGPDGTMLANFLNGETAPLLDVRDRQYFQTFAETPTNHIYVSEPIKGKASGHWIILFSRPLLRAGKLHGAVFVGFDAQHFDHLFEGVDHPHMVTTLLSPGGRIIARSHLSETAIGTRIDMRNLATPASGLLEAPSPLDQVTRLYASLTVPGWGMQVFTGYEKAALSAHSDETRQSVYLAAMGLSCALALVCVLAWYILNARERAHLTQQNEMTRSRRILSSMVEGVAILDGAGRLEFINPTLEGVMGETVGHHFAAALARAGLHWTDEQGQPGTDTDPIQTRCLDQGLPVKGLWLMGQGPLSKRFQATATPLSDASGRHSGAIITLVDETDEFERRSEMAITATVVSQMNDGVLVMDPNGKILRTNPAASGMSGFSAEELAQRYGRQLLAPRNNPDLAGEIAAALEQHHQWMGRVWIKRKDASEFCCAQSISPVRNERGTLIRHVAVWRDVTQKEVEEQELWRRANYDPLTHLANRQRFEDRLEHTFAQAERHKTRFAVCLLDLDYFKKVNDRLGHAAGDALLREAAQRMQELVREGDTLARIGGDEFALIAPEIHTPQDAEITVEKLVRAIALPFLLTAGEARVSLSAGIAVYPLHGKDHNTLLNAADRAVYEAKGQGRNGYVMATFPGTEEAASSKISPTS